jgi:hypothetical protein
MKNPKFWNLMKAGSVLGWIFIFYGILFPFQGGVMNIIWWCILLGWGVGHPLELMSSLPIAKDKEISLEIAFAKTMIFGFTWWLPLKMGVTQD